MALQQTKLQTNNTKWNVNYTWYKNTISTSYDYSNEYIATLYFFFSTEKFDNGWIQTHVDSHMHVQRQSLPILC